MNKEVMDVLEEIVTIWA